MSERRGLDQPAAPISQSPSNDDFLGDYIGAMFAEPPQLDSLFPSTPEWVEVKQALQCTWREARTPVCALATALVLWQMYHRLPPSRLRNTLRTRGLQLLHQSMANRK